MLSFELLFQMQVVLDEPVVHQGHPLPVVVVGMRVHISLVAMSGPACVADAHAVIVFALCLTLQSLDAISTEALSRSTLGECEGPLS